MDPLPALACGAASVLPGRDVVVWRMVRLLRPSYDPSYRRALTAFVELLNGASASPARQLLDNIETLFTGLSDAAALRAELCRLFRWLDDHNLTAIVTAEPETTAR